MADERDNELPRALRTSDLSRVKALPFKHRPIVARARPIPARFFALPIVFPTLIPRHGDASRDPPPW